MQKYTLGQEIENLVMKSGLDEACAYANEAMDLKDEEIQKLEERIKELENQ